MSPLPKPIAAERRFIQAKGNSEKCGRRAMPASRRQTRIAVRAPTVQDLGKSLFYCITLV